jgi:hypothetical protein|tara:strand:+ start:5028 stop:5837 length:810 start_codon:yes stop_codon:yes gene_type:complete
MKNVVLVDFTDESIDALNYAIGFSQAMKAELEILNVSDEAHGHSAEKQLVSLKKEYSSESFNINIIKLSGDIEEAIKSYINANHIGFVFSGTHELKLMEQFFSSRTLNLLNEVKANFLFVPHNLKSYRQINSVFLPILEDKKSLQSIEELRYLHHSMNFEIILGTYASNNIDPKKNELIAIKLLSEAGIKYSTLVMGTSESTLKKELTELDKIGNADLISIVNLTEENIFNAKEKGYVEDLIRNKEGLPVLVIQNRNVSTYSGFRAMGG